MLHIAGSLPAMRKSNTKVQKKMHICKSPRRKIARKCIFCAGVPAYARIRAGATAQKSNRAAIFSSGETLSKCPALPCSTFGGWRSQLTFGFERKWQRGASPRRRYRGVPKIQKKSSRVSQRSCFAQNFCNSCTLFPIYALPVTTKPADAYAYNYKEHQGYTDVQGYAVEPRDVTFGWKLHKHLFGLIDSVGGCNCSIAP